MVEVAVIGGDEDGVDLAYGGPAGLLVESGTLLVCSFGELVDDFHDLLLEADGLMETHRECRV